MKKAENIIVGISIGDLNGIGGEVVLKTFEDARVLEFCTPVIFASSKVMAFLKTHFKSEINFNDINNLNQLVFGRVNVLNCWNEPVKIEFGQEDFKIGEYAIKSLQEATKALKNNTIDVLVTATINKHNIQSKEFNLTGHTDYFAQEPERESLI